MVYHSPAGLPVPSAPSDPELRHDPDDPEAPRTSAPPDLNDPRAKRAKELKEAERNAVSRGDYDAALAAKLQYDDLMSEIQNDRATF